LPISLRVIDTFGDSASTTVIGNDADEVVEVALFDASFDHAPRIACHLTPRDVFLD
jgi:hypothetical protein